MATIIINNSEYAIPEGEKLNAIQMAQRVGVDIPYYCWHPALLGRRQLPDVRDRGRQ